MTDEFVVDGEPAVARSSATIGSVWLDSTADEFLMHFQA